MVSKRVLNDIENSSAIRAAFTIGQEMAAKVGKENVYDFSLGNPIAPVPKAFPDAIRYSLEHEDSHDLHGYMANAGYPDVRKKVADYLNRTFDFNYGVDDIIMTVGAAGALNVVFKTLSEPGDEAIVFAPFFSEYRNYFANWGGELVSVQPDSETLLPDMEDFERKIGPKTAMVILCNPVNPTGVVYGEDTIRQIADILERKQKELGRDIYIVSDEPYRDLVYDGMTVPFVPHFYDNAIFGYSFSKKMSIPGERIGFIAVSPRVNQHELTCVGLATSNRLIGFINAPSLQQKAIARCLEVKPDITFYDKNRKTLYEGLTRLGFTVLYPQGAFYMVIKSPVPDEMDFVKAAMEFNILLVTCAAFDYKGWVRLAYCVDPDMIERSMPAFAKLAAHYNLTPKND